MRRDATRVIYDILLSARTGISKTHLVYKANLNFRLAEKYLEFLLTKRLLAETQTPRETRLYQITEKGENLLGFLDQVERELADVNPMSPASTPLAARQFSRTRPSLDTPLVRAGQGKTLSA